MTEPQARILRIERLSTFDGEGLRTVVFLKGCPLACRWCSTPESQRGGPDFGVARSKCTGCFACTEACPEKALSWDIQSERFMTDMSRCTDCRQCIAACPTGAREAWGYTATAGEIFREVEKDSLFYFHSGGGVTISGGEPLVQAAFTANLLERCITHGISTAIETSGSVPWENMAPALPWTDTLFYDLKHMDDEAHRRLTGKGNTRILENLKQADASDNRFSIIVRMPVIPGCNDDPDNIQALGDHCRNLKKLTEIQLLPYHRLGIETYRRMSLAYGLEGVASPDTTTMESLADILRQMDLPVRIGS
ncbi:MAG: glycyl-radical enzyme activating protein [Desulfobacterales bacterium]|nr:glycyl-radical enzyme activating protein [Desulfobacterales bacterium]